jgi:hypothetical protein
VLKWYIIHTFNLTPLASLHLAYHAIHITLHRKIITAIAMHHPGLNVRPAPGAFDKAREAAEASVEWLSQIRPEHLEGFWYNASRNNLVLLGTFITLLQAVAFTTADRESIKKLFERLKWQLRIFSRGNELFEGALRRVDEKRTWVESVLEKGFIPIRPPPPRPVVRSFQPYPPAGIGGGSAGGFVDFGGQSMEELLQASEGLANNNEFPDGFLGFEEYSGWDGFGIQDL